MQRVLITGGTGFIGHNVAAGLRLEHDLVVQTAGRSGNVDLLHADLSAEGEAQSLIERSSPDAIIHCVGARNGSDDELRAANAVAQREVLRAAAMLPAPPRIILMGSAAEYGPQPGSSPITETAQCRPTSTYGRTKLAATRLALCYRRHTRMRITVVRPFNVVGQGMHGLLGKYLRARADGEAVADKERQLSCLPLVRDFVAVADVTAACRRLLALENPPALLNVCTGTGRSFAEIFAQLKTLMGEATEPWGARGEDDGIVGDPAFCESVIGFRPSTDITDALREAAEGIGCRT
jgi:Nucleoside-diphosphate-sugar epimerases